MYKCLQNCINLCFISAWSSVNESVARNNGVQYQVLGLLKGLQLIYFHPDRFSLRPLQELPVKKFRSNILAWLDVLS